MSDIRAKVQQKNKDRLTDGRFKDLNLLRDGTLVVAKYGMAAALEGALYGVHFGSVTTPLATAATTAIAAQRPMAWLRVPATRAIIPVLCEIVVESQGATTQGEIAIARTSNDVGNGTSTAGNTPVALNPYVNVGTSAVVARYLSTGDCTAETDLLELKRFSFAASAVNQQFTWEPKEWFPALPGPSSFLIYIGGNAVNFYATVIWVEGPPELAD